MKAIDSHGIDTQKRAQYSDSGWVRLEVNGHYMGKAHPESGVVILYHRGETRVFDLAEIANNAN